MGLSFGLRWSGGRVIGCWIGAGTQQGTQQSLNSPQFALTPALGTEGCECPLLPEPLRAVLSAKGTELAHPCAVAVRSATRHTFR